MHRYIHSHEKLNYKKYDIKYKDKKHGRKKCLNSSFLN